ncbi:MAG: hypothetical protein HFI82_12365 [Eubacterium sp.]|jgi:hypothetical protein|nr:hypothetical protein [Eubacterium sp.]
MGKNVRRYVLIAAIAVLCMLPQKILAQNTEYDLNQNKTVTIAQKDSYADSGNYTWLKYTPKADGRLTITLSDPEYAAQNAKGYIALYNGTKTRILSSKSIFYNTQNSNHAFWNEIAFGLQKGQSYYIRIKGDSGVKITRTFSKIKNKAGSLKSKAVTIKKNKFKSGIIPAGVSTADWYKVKLTKKQKIRIYYNIKSRGTFKISFYSGSQLYASQNVSYTAKQKKFTIYLEVSQKQTGLQPGVYYIKIERADSGSSGSYKIKWN